MAIPLGKYDIGQMSNGVLQMLTDGCVSDFRAFLSDDLLGRSPTEFLNRRSNTNLETFHAMALSPNQSLGAD